MEFVELTEQEYESFWKTHPLKTFLSAKEIGKLREKRNWNVYYVGLKEHNKIYGAAMLLSRKKKFNMYEFYSPRGFLIDYNNKSLLELFTKEVSKFIKTKKGYILRIDPYIINHERDRNGNIIENGIDNEDIITSLKNIGFKKVPPKNKEQVSWMFSLDLEGKTEEEILNEMKPNTRNIIRKAEKSGITIKELSFDELPKFNNIIKETGKRRERNKIRKSYQTWQERGTEEGYKFIN